MLAVMQHFGHQLPANLVEGEEERREENYCVYFDGLFG